MKFTANKHPGKRGYADDELTLQNGRPMKGVKPYFQLGPLLKALIIANPTYIEPEFRLS